MTPEEREVVEAAERWLAWLETDSEEYGPEPSVEQLRTLLAIAKRADAPASEEHEAGCDALARAAIDALRHG